MSRQMACRIVLTALLAAFVAGCSAGSAPEARHDHPMADLKQFPDYVQSAPVRVQQAYQFAAANPDLLRQVNCYCGCVAAGHTSNYACYVSGTAANGDQTYDAHAIGCSICADITQDAMTLHAQGKSAQEIHDYVDSTYAKYGPSTGTTAGH